METLSMCEVCGRLLDGGDYVTSVYTVHHMGKLVTTCFTCKTKPLCVANPDGPHGEIVGTDEPKFDPDNMLVGPLPEDRVFGYCVKCLLPWEWFPERQDWEPLTWQRLSYLWAERASGALDVDDREAIDVRVTGVDMPDALFVAGMDLTVTLTLAEVCPECGTAGNKSTTNGCSREHREHRVWVIKNATPFAPDSEIIQLAGAWGAKDGAEFDPEDLQGFKCKVEVLNGAITRVL